MLVSKNCKAILHRLRRVAHERELWIDSICIDQASIEDRTEQVKLMPRIYAGAAEVIIWIGESNTHSSQIMSFFQKFENGSNPAEDSFLTAQVELIETQGTTQRVKSSIFEDIFERSWFQRMWTLQEVSLRGFNGCKFICGPDETTWYAVCMATFFLIEHCKKEYNYLDVIANAVLHRNMTFQCSAAQSPDGELRRRAWTFFGTTTASSTGYPKNLRDSHLTFLHIACRSKGASVAKDKIFALHGVLRLLHIDHPLPDYAKSVETVFTEATEMCIRVDNSLDVLYFVPSLPRLPNLPSWVPDWSQPNWPFTMASYYNDSSFTSSELLFQSGPWTRILDDSL